LEDHQEESLLGDYILMVILIFVSLPLVFRFLPYPFQVAICKSLLFIVRRCITFAFDTASLNELKAIEAEERCITCTPSPALLG
jgi:hypothetical protein